MEPNPQPRAAANPASPSILSSALSSALATWVRYLVPLTLLSAIALAPQIVVALRVRAPVDQATANAVIATAWTMLGAAWLGQLVLVGGATAMTRGTPSQLQALGGGFVQLMRAIVPCLAAAVAIAIAGLALVVPGLVLVVLLALTGASGARGLPARLVDSIAVARRHLPAVALVVAAMLALDAAIGLCAYRGFVVALSRPPTPEQLASVRHFVHALALALVVASPLPATVLATIRTRAAP